MKWTSNVDKRRESNTFKEDRNSMLKVVDSTRKDERLRGLDYYVAYD